MKNDLAQVANMNHILNVFEELSGLKINLHKNEFYCFGKAKELEHEYLQLFVLGWVHSPLSTLVSRYTTESFATQAIEDRCELVIGDQKNLSYGGCLVLINIVPSSLPISMVSFLEILKQV